MSKLKIGNWETLGQDASRVRTAVFVIEQGIPVAMEWDDAAEICTHAVVYGDKQTPLATGRLLPGELDHGIKTSKIGRMAVLPSARGQGWGAKVLAALMQVAQARGDAQIELHAQQSAIDFYLKQCYQFQGEPSLEVGIPHQDMVFQF